ncbi:MAG: phage virion morphogenesis protein [Pontibacterium sp.]
MAGTQQQITVDYDDAQLQDALSRVLKLVENPKPAMAEIAEYLHGRSRENFDKEQAPDGTPWKPLQDSTKKAKLGRVPINKILHGQTLHLRDTIFPFFSNSEAGVSTGLGTEEYAAAQQLGTQGITIKSHTRLIKQAFGNPLPFPVYANIGAHKGNIPARPFLGLSNDDEAEIIAVLQQAIENAL